MNWRSLTKLVLVAALAAVQGPSEPATNHQLPRPAVAAEANRHLPVRLEIPKIGVDAVVEWLGVDRNDDMDVPSAPGDVGWYSPGPAPGEEGNAVIDGHLDWSAARAVFWDLARLGPGDEVRVLTGDGLSLRFVVAGIQHVRYTDHPVGVFARVGDPTLSLITCTGLWDRTRHVYLERLIVTSRLVDQG